MNLIAVLLVGVFVLVMYLWTPKTGKGVAIYCGIVLLLALGWFVARFSH